MMALMDADPVMERRKFGGRKHGNYTPVPPYHHDDHTMATLLSSSLYCVIAIGVIGVLLLVFVALFYFYWTRIRNAKLYSPKTVRYSPLVVSDPSLSGDEERTHRMGARWIPPGYPGTRPAATYTPTKSPAPWPSVPVSPHMDISAGHLLLTYIDENLQNRHKLQQEWKNLQAYTPEDSSSTTAILPLNRSKNRYPDALPYDHNLVKLNAEENSTSSDYVNASFIVDIDPHHIHPRYIATQGPLLNTIADFWQMVWEQKVSVIVMLTAVRDMGLSQSSQYWPTSGVDSYHIYEVRLVSEHPHSQDYIIRSFYLQNMRTKESRTVTHFQYLTWSTLGVPPTATPLLEFRRKVNKAHACLDTPLLVHCNGGVGRTGTYILIDLALSRIQSGAKEINLAATVEHLRDNRAHMVKTQAQFEFALAALVEETHSMLDAARQRTH